MVPKLLVIPVTAMPVGTVVAVTVRLPATVSLSLTVAMVAPVPVLPRWRDAATPAVIVGAEPVLVSEKLTEVAPFALAETVYGPPMVVLAVAVEDATPLLIVAGLAAGVQLAPLPGGVNVTCPPLTGSLLAEVTVTLKAVPKAEPAAVLWLLPPLTAKVKPRDSNAPMSTLPTRAMPRWSLVGAPVAVPAFIAGLPGKSACVCVSPP